MAILRLSSCRYLAIAVLTSSRVRDFIIFAEARQMSLAVDAVEAIVDAIAESLPGGFGEVQVVLAEERASELEALFAHALIDQHVDLAQRCAQGEEGLVVGQGSDPDFENLMLATDSGWRHLT